MLTDANSENVHSHGNASVRAKIAGSIGNRKLSATPAGLTQRDANADEKSVQRQLPRNKIAQPMELKAAIEEDDIEFCPSNSPQEPEDYLDIISFNERPTPQMLKKILCTPIQSFDSDVDLSNADELWNIKDAFTQLVDHPENLIAEDITENFQLSSLDGMDLDDCLW